jgi:hypothetical protein
MRHPAQWILSESRELHSRSVTSVDICGKWTVSGGADGRLVFSTTPPEKDFIVSPLVDPSRVQVSCMQIAFRFL